jgi:hypothetical protein
MNRRDGIDRNICEILYRYMKMGNYVLIERKALIIQIFDIYLCIRQLDKLTHYIITLIVYSVVQY